MIALTLSYGAYVAEVVRAGHHVGAPEPGRSARRALGLTVRADDATGRAAAGHPPGDAAAAQRLRVAAEGHRAGVGARRLVEALRAAQVRSSADFNFTPYVVAALLLHRDDGADRAVRRLAGAAPAAARAGPGARVTVLHGDDAVVPLLRVEGVRKRYGRHDVLAGIDLDDGGRRGGLPDRRVGVGQVDPAALPRPAGAGRRRHRVVRRPRRHRSAGRRRRGAATHRAGVPGVQPVPAPVCAGQRHAGAAAGARPGPARGAGARRWRCSSGSGWPTRRPPIPTACPAASSSGSRWSAPSPTAPRLLLLDEVTSALDPELVAEVLDDGRRATGRRA